MAFAAPCSGVVMAMRLSPDSAGDRNTVANIIATQQVRPALALMSIDVILTIIRADRSR
jgi:hypothetical protein